MHYFSRLILLPALLLATALPASAAPPTAGETASTGVDLASVVDTALQRHPAYQTLAAADDEANALDRRARSLVSDQPSLSLHLQDDRLASDTGFREWEAGVDMPLWRPGQRRAARDLGDSARDEAVLRHRTLSLQVAGEVREAAWTLAIARNRARLAEQELATARELEGQVQTLLERGDVPRTDLLMAREETLQREAAFHAAHTEAHHALVAWQALTGMADLPDRLAETRATGELQASPLLAEAQALAARALAEQALVREQAGGAPVLTVGGRSEDDGFGQTRDSLGVGLSIPLGLKSHRGPAEAAAARQLAAAQAERDRQHRQLSLAVAEAEEAITMSTQTLAIARARHELAAENLSLARKAYALGETGLSDLLRVQTRAFTAERDAVLRELERDRAIARYNQALGVAP